MKQAFNAWEMKDVVNLSYRMAQLSRWDQYLVVVAKTYSPARSWLGHSLGAKITAGLWRKQLRAPSIARKARLNSRFAHRHYLAGKPSQEVSLKGEVRYPSVHCEPCFVGTSAGGFQLPLRASSLGQ